MAAVPTWTDYEVVLLLNAEMLAAKIRAGTPALGISAELVTQHDRARMGLISHAACAEHYRRHHRKALKDVIRAIDRADRHAPAKRPPAKVARAARLQATRRIRGGA